MTTLEHFMYCRTKITALFDVMRPYLPKRDLEQVESLVNADEWGVALEQLLGAVVEEQLPFPSAALQISEELAKAMNMEDDECLVSLRRRDGPTS
jgi:hypothetical protein